MRLSADAEADFGESSIVRATRRARSIAASDSSARSASTFRISG
jgi:hypothetical protein